MLFLRVDMVSKRSRKTCLWCKAGGLLRWFRASLGICSFKKRVQDPGTEYEVLLVQRAKEGYPSTKMGRSGLAQGQGVHREMKFERFEEKVLANLLPGYCFWQFSSEYNIPNENQQYGANYGWNFLQDGIFSGIFSLTVHGHESILHLSISI